MLSLFWEHVKLNVAISRIKKPQNLCILLPEKEKESDCLIKYRIFFAMKGRSLILNNQYVNDLRDMTNIMLIVFCEARLIEEDTMESGEGKDTFQLISRVISIIFKDFYLKIDDKTMFG